jgi:hypothetical protein
MQKRKHASVLVRYSDGACKLQLQLLPLVPGSSETPAILLVALMQLMAVRQCDGHV